MPLFANARDSVVGMGLSEEKLFEAMARFEKPGDRQPIVRRNPSYLVLKEFGKMVADRSHPYHLLSDAVSGLVEHYPRWMRSEEHTSELPSLMRNSYAVF